MEQNQLSIEEFEELYTDNSINYGCAMSMFFEREICVKAGIKNIISLGHSPYQIAYGIQKYTNNDPNINIIYIPFSGKFPSTYDIFSVNPNPDPFQSIYSFYQLNKKIIDGFYENTQLLNIIDIMTNDKIAIIDYLHSGGGITAFVLVIIICIVAKKCNSVIDFGIECREMMTTCLKNANLYCITSVDNTYFSNFNFDFIRDIMGLDIDFNENVYINYDLVLPSNMDLYSENSYHIFDKATFVFQRSKDEGRCLPSYKPEAWDKNYESYQTAFEHSRFQKYCNFVRAKIDYAFEYNYETILDIYIKVFENERFNNRAQELAIKNEYNNDDDDEPELNVIYLIIDFDCTISYINFTDAFNYHRTGKYDSVYSIAVLKKNNITIEQLNKILRNRYTWKKNRKLLLDVIFGGPKRLKMLIKFFNRMRNYVNYINISSSGVCEQIYRILKFFGLDKYFNEVITLQTYNNSGHCILDEIRYYIERILQRRNTFIFYIDDNDIDYDNIEGDTGRIFFFGSNYGLENEHNGLDKRIIRNIINGIEQYLNRDNDQLGGYYLKKYFKYLTKCARLRQVLIS